jgi:hypothetical protein
VTLLAALSEIGFPQVSHTVFNSTLVFSLKFNPVHLIATLVIPRFDLYPTLPNFLPLIKELFPVESVSDGNSSNA